MKHTVKVPLADIKAFRKNSSFIKNNSILPIYGFIKFDNGTITKNSKNEFVIQESNFSGSFLVEEKVLFNYIENVTASDILFTVEEKKIIISDGKTKFSCPTDDIRLYPICEEPPQKQYTFDDNIIKSIGASVNFIQDDEYDLIISHIFLGNRTIAASNRMIGYCKEVDAELPITAIHKSTAERISKMSAGLFSETDTKLFYQMSNMTYGFSKTEATHVDLRQYFKLERGASFVLPKIEISDFNNICLAISPLKKSWPTIKGEGKKIHLSDTDADYDRNGDKDIDIIGEYTGSFRYDAVLMNRVLSGAPDETLTFHQSKGMLYITGESGFNSFIMELVTPANK